MAAEKVLITCVKKKKERDGQELAHFLCSTD